MTSRSRKKQARIAVRHNFPDGSPANFMADFGSKRICRAQKRIHIYIYMYTHTFSVFAMCAYTYMHIDIDIDADFDICIYRER